MKITYLQLNWNLPGTNKLTHTQLEMPGLELSAATTDALVLKHQAISICSADQVCIVPPIFIHNYDIHGEQHEKLELYF